MQTVQDICKCNTHKPDKSKRKIWLCDVEAKENWASVSRVIIPTSNVHECLKYAREGERGEKYISSKWKTRTALRLKLSPHMFILCLWRHAPTGFNGWKWQQQKQCKIWCVNWCVEGVDENMEIQGDDSGMSNTVGWDHGISMWKKLASPIKQSNSLDFLPALSIFIGSAMQSEFSCKCCHGRGQTELHLYSQNEKLH